jgi:hypothetical protein
MKKVTWNKLKRFCQKWEYAKHRRPYRDIKSGKIFATNGHMLVVCDVASGEITPSISAPDPCGPPLEIFFEMRKNAIWPYVELIENKWMNEASRPIDGNEKERCVEFLTDDVYFNMHYYRQLKKAFDGLKFARVKDRKGEFLFMFNGGWGVMMGVIKGDF